jgi:hypothetical protein
MLFAFKQQSVDPMDPVYLADTGISSDQFVDLAKATGLRTIPQVNQSYGWSFINDLLSKYGPIWAAGDWNGGPHIIVLTGVDSSGMLMVNDPAFSTPQVRNMGWFNQHIDASLPIPMMYLPD